ncbi:DNA-binding protein [Alkalicoccobacillus porphyridii]|uniref:DNA-binding protein n=1 Tax=Alkalicoccobacillus porphyridii TaxID=2597270 RepID=A0A554A4K5_9BACI|nr:DNA-binding protein [Alkalicoccobacillus porphyridii]
MDLEKYPNSLDVKHIKEILGIGQRQVNELLNDPPFHVVRVGKKFVVSKHIFFRWFMGLS